MIILTACAEEIATCQSQNQAKLVPLMAELLLSRMDTSRRGAPVLFGRGGGKPAAAGAAASLFVRAVGQDDPAGAAVGAAAGGTGVSVRTTALPRMMKLMEANEEDACEVGICIGRSGAPYADAELISTLF